jgi:hypothetical protein
MTTPSPAAMKAESRIADYLWISLLASPQTGAISTIIDQALAEERKAADAMDNVLFALTVAAGTDEVLWNEAREAIAAYRRARGQP